MIARALLKHSIQDQNSPIQINRKNDTKK
jgi:hypothetical protein